MSWVSIIWGMVIGGCAAMALPHLLVGFWQRRGAHLFFVLATAAVITIAIGELAMMRAESVEQFAQTQRWMQLPVFLLVLALVSFVQLYLRTGRLWLGISACTLRFASLILSFLVGPTLNYSQISGLKSVPFLGEMVSRPVAVVSPRIYLPELSSLLLFLFVLDAAVRLWRKGEPENRRRAVIVGGSIAFFVLLAAGIAALAHREIIQGPYVISFPFAAILVAMAFELGSDLFRAGQVAHRLELSEASRHESEARFRTAADAAPVLMWMAGLDKLCTFFNKAWLEFTGRTMDQELGESWSEGVHPDDRKQCLETYAAAFHARQSFVMQYRLRRADGEYRMITDHGVPRYDAGNKFLGYIGACVDITDLLKQEKTLHQIEERVALATEAAQLGVWELDPKTDQIWVSDKVRSLFGFHADYVSHKEFQERVHPDDRPNRDTVVRNAIETGGGYEIEFRIVQPDGSVRWIGGRARCVTDHDTGSIRLVGVSMDVTNRKQAEQLFQLATEASPSGTLLVDGQGRIVLVNVHIEELFGYARDQLIGRPVEVLVPKRFVANHPAHRANFLAAPEPRMMGAGRELTGRRKDGREFPVEIGLNPIETPQGMLVLATVVDISARKAAEEEARRRREQIDLLSRVSLLGEMTASIAHELNQPLSAIVSNASAGQRFIDKGNVDPETLREILVDVAADGRRAHDVLQNIRNTIKKGAAVRQLINLNEVVTNVAHLIQPNAVTSSCEVETSLENDLPPAEGDPIQIQQVLINLVNNAFDAMREVPPTTRKVEISTGRNGDGMICVCVRDHGKGIAEEAREHLFEQFFTTKREGLGMGLAIVRSIIEAHGGHIEAENAESEGARFYFTLPAHQPTPS